MVASIKKGNDNLITLAPMKRASTRAYVNDATVTYALKEDSGGSPGTSISGGTGTLAYVAGSNGKYQGTIESSVSLPAVGTTVWLCVTFTSGTLNGYAEIECEIQRRGQGG